MPRLTNATTPTRPSVWIIFAVLTLTSAAAWAAGNPLISAGIGSNLGVSNSTQLDGTSVTGFSNELSVRMKALYVLGLELGYSPTDHQDSGQGLVFTNDLRLSGLLYFVPTPVVSAYAKGGIEADHFGGLFSISDPSNAYHLGGGLDFDLTDHVTLGFEFLMLIPGRTSVEQSLSAHATQQYAQYEAALTTGAAFEPTTPEVGDIINPNNFRMTLGARYTF